MTQSMYDVGMDVIKTLVEHLEQETFKALYVTELALNLTILRIREYKFRGLGVVFLSCSLRVSHATLSGKNQRDAYMYLWAYARVCCSYKA
jgi:hypothetical protein